MLRRITLSATAVLAFALLAVSCTTTPPRTPSAASFSVMPGQRPPVIEMLPIAALDGLKIRAGYYPEFEGRELKGCVLYLQGLGDSSLNHVPFFSYLNASGYRVLFFDYMGQGGSEGSMNNTRILATSAKEKKYEIQALADVVWDKYKCEGQTKKVVIGWSTGGLAGYRMAYEKKVDAAVLFAPGLNPRWFVGESAHRPDKMLSLSEVITTRTLTRRGPENNAIEVHVDAVKPNTPAVIPKFAVNLLSTAKTARKWWMPKEVEGFVVLSGDEDTYVDTNKNRDTIQDRARNFTLIQYEHALHEVDNELPEVINDLYPRVTAFLDGVFKP